MPSVRSLCIIFSFLFVVAKATGQKKELVLDSGLVANSEAYKVKYKFSFRSMPRFRFGTFKVLEGKSGWIKTSRVSKIWSKEAIYQTENKFSFTISDDQSNIATVNALNIIMSTYSKSTEIFASDKFSLTIGDGRILSGAEIFTASINTTFDEEDDWVLRVEAVEDEVSYREVKSTLENGTRVIEVKLVSSPYKEGSSTIPAIGYEFYENEISIGAVKYFPAAVAYKKIWLRAELDAQTQLLIAAASATIIHWKGV